MLALIELLPTSWQSRAKAIVAAIGIVLAAVVAGVPELPRWAFVVVAALTALGVHQAPAPGYVAPSDALVGLP